MRENTGGAHDSTHRPWAIAYDRYMTCIVMLSSLLIYFQAAIMWENRTTYNVSVLALWLFLVVALSWLVYGLLWSQWIVSVAGAVATVGGIWAVVTAWSYGRPTRSVGAFHM